MQLNIRWYVILALAVLAATGCRRDPGSEETLTPEGRYQEDVFADVVVTRDIVYGSATDQSGLRQDLRLDLYEPANDTASRRAAIVWIHGGGFVGGDKGVAQMKTLAERFARKGYLAVSINYRLASDEQLALAPWPVMRDAMYDAKAAVRWLRACREQHRVDIDRIVAGGGSAGAYTALHTAYVAGEGDSGNPGSSSAVSAVVDFWGSMADVTAMEAGEAPLIVIHGTLDPVVPIALAEQLVSRARQVGVDCQYHPLAGTGHSAWDRMEQYIAWITPFLYKHLFQ